jgi:hypothetical protein
MSAALSARLVTVPDAAPPYDGEPASDVPRAALPSPAPATCVPVPVADDDPVIRFAHVLVEAIAGSRPVRQLAPFMTQRAGLHLRRVGPLFAGSRPRVLRVLTTRPAPEVAEATVIVSCDQRARALALRLERQEPGRWICTDIEAG